MLNLSADGNRGANSLILLGSGLVLRAAAWNCLGDECFGSSLKVRVMMCVCHGGRSLPSPSKGSKD